jgi:pimeloyl-ACP methyl ester carboxylesterase
VRGLVLVDGGLPFPKPAGEDVDAQLEAMLGPTLDRLGRSFPDPAAVRDFWAGHPTIGPWVDDPGVAAFLARDLLGSAPPELRSSVSPEAVRVDGADLLDDERVEEASTDLPVPAILLWATRGMDDELPGLFDDDRLTRLGATDLARMTTVEVPGTNHDSIVWAPQGVAAIADAVRRAGR